MKKLTFLLLAFMLTIAIIPIVGCRGDNIVSDVPTGTSTAYVIFYKHKFVYHPYYKDSIVEIYDALYKSTACGSTERDSVINYLKNISNTTFYMQGGYEVVGYRVQTVTNISWKPLDDYNKSVGFEERLTSPCFLKN